MSVANVETVATATKSAGIRYVHSDAAVLAFTESVRRAVDSGPQELVDAPADPSELPRGIFLSDLPGWNCLRRMRFHSIWMRHDSMARPAVETGRLGLVGKRHHRRPLDLWMLRANDGEMEGRARQQVSPHCRHVILI